MSLLLFFTQSAPTTTPTRIIACRASAASYVLKGVVTTYTLKASA